MIDLTRLPAESDWRLVSAGRIKQFSDPLKTLGFVNPDDPKNTLNPEPTTPRDLPIFERPDTLPFEYHNILNEALLIGSMVRSESPKEYSENGLTVKSGFEFKPGEKIDFDKTESLNAALLWGQTQGSLVTHWSGATNIYPTNIRKAMMELDPINQVGDSAFDWMAKQDTDGWWSKFWDSYGKVPFIQESRAKAEANRLEEIMSAKAEGWDASVASNLTEKYLQDNPRVNLKFSSSGLNLHEYTKNTTNPVAWAYQLNRAIVDVEHAERMERYIQDTGMFKQIMDNLVVQAKTDPGLAVDVGLTAATFLVPGIGEIAAARLLGPASKVTQGLAKATRLMGGPMTGPIEGTVYTGLRSAIPGIARSGVAATAARLAAVTTEGAIAAGLGEYQKQKELTEFNDLLLDGPDYSNPETDWGAISSAAGMGGFISGAFYGTLRLAMGSLIEGSILLKSPKGTRYWNVDRSLLAGSDNFAKSDRGLTIWGSTLGEGRGILGGDYLDRYLAKFDGRNDLGVIFGNESVESFTGLTADISAKQGYDLKMAQAIEGRLKEMITPAYVTHPNFVDPERLDSSGLTYDDVNTVLDSVKLTPEISGTKREAVILRSLEHYRQNKLISKWGFKDSELNSVYKKLYNGETFDPNDPNALLKREDAMEYLLGKREIANLGSNLEALANSLEFPLGRLMKPMFNLEDGSTVDSIVVTTALNPDHKILVSIGNNGNTTKIRYGEILTAPKGTTKEVDFFDFVRGFHSRIEDIKAAKGKLDQANVQDFLKELTLEGNDIKVSRYFAKQRAKETFKNLQLKTTQDIFAFGQSTLGKIDDLKKAGDNPGLLYEQSVLGDSLRGAIDQHIKTFRAVIEEDELKQLYDLQKKLYARRPAKVARDSTKPSKGIVDKGLDKALEKLEKEETPTDIAKEINKKEPKVAMDGFRFEFRRSHRINQENLMKVLGYDEAEAKVATAIFHLSGLSPSDISKRWRMKFDPTENAAEFAKIEMMQNKLDGAVESIMRFNKSTEPIHMAHELGHYLEQLYIGNTAKVLRDSIGITDDEYGRMLKWLKEPTDVESLSDSASERFANGWMKFLQGIFEGNAKAPTPELQVLFEKLTEHVSHLGTNIGTHNDVPVSATAKAFYQRLLERAIRNQDILYLFPDPIRGRIKDIVEPLKAKQISDAVVAKAKLSNAKDKARVIAPAPSSVDTRKLIEISEGFRKEISHSPKKEPKALKEKKAKAPKPKLTPESKKNLETIISDVREEVLKRTNKFNKNLPPNVTNEDLFSDVIIEISDKPDVLALKESDLKNYLVGSIKRRGLNEIKRAKKSVDFSGEVQDSAVAKESVSAITDEDFNNATVKIPDILKDVEDPVVKQWAGIRLTHMLNLKKAGHVGKELKPLPLKEMFKMVLPDEKFTDGKALAIDRKAIKVIKDATTDFVNKSMSKEEATTRSSDELAREALDTAKGRFRKTLAEYNQLVKENTKKGITLDPEAVAKKSVEVQKTWGSVVAAKNILEDLRGFERFNEDDLKVMKDFLTGEFIPSDNSRFLKEIHNLNVDTIPDRPAKLDISGIRSIRDLKDDDRYKFMAELRARILEQAGTKLDSQNAITWMKDHIPGAKWIAKKYAKGSQGAVRYGFTVDSDVPEMQWLVKFLNVYQNITDKELSNNYSLKTIQVAEAESHLILGSTGYQDIVNKMSKLDPEKFQAVEHNAFAYALRPNELPKDTPDRSLVLDLIGVAQRYDSLVVENAIKYGHLPEGTQPGGYGFLHLPNRRAHSRPAEFYSAIKNHYLRQYEKTNEMHLGTLAAMEWISVRRAGKDHSVSGIVVSESSPVAKLLGKDDFANGEAKLSLSEAKKLLRYATDDGAPRLPEDTIKRYKAALRGQTEDYGSGWRGVRQDPISALEKEARIEGSRRLGELDAEFKDEISGSKYNYVDEDPVYERKLTHEALVGDPDLLQFFQTNSLWLMKEHNHRRLHDVMITKAITDNLGIRMSFEDMIDAFRMNVKTFAEGHYEKSADRLQIVKEFEEGLDHILNSYRAHIGRLQQNKGESLHPFIEYTAKQAHNIMNITKGTQVAVNNWLGDGLKAFAKSDKGSALITQILPNLGRTLRSVIPNGRLDRINKLGAIDAIKWLRLISENQYTLRLGDPWSDEMILQGANIGMRNDTGSALHRMRMHWKSEPNAVTRFIKTFGVVPGSFVRQANETIYYVHAYSLASALSNRLDTMIKLGDLLKDFKGNRGKFESLASSVGLHPEEAIQLSSYGLLEPKLLRMMRRGLKEGKAVTETGLPDFTKMYAWAETLSGDDKVLAREATSKMVAYIDHTMKNSNREPTLLDYRTANSAWGAIMRVFLGFNTANTSQMWGQLSRSRTWPAIRALMGTFITEFAIVQVLDYFANHNTVEEKLQNMIDNPVPEILMGLTRLPIYGTYGLILKPLIATMYLLREHISGDPAPYQFKNAAVIPEFGSNPLQVTVNQATRDFSRLPDMIGSMSSGAPMDPRSKERLLKMVPFLGNAVVGRWLRSFVMEDSDIDYLREQQRVRRGVPLRGTEVGSSDILEGLPKKESTTVPPSSKPKELSSPTLGQLITKQDSTSTKLIKALNGED